ncbi:hypothetical protein [Elizabethkingia anophelis]|uniref:hypothetical protein n=1 Tax=Elizabethkingia anophelis TaxID=1117645 RepID=UPI002922620C|nr:MAG: hypothetical protein PQ275_23960 [Elizabethkingia anophelis]HAY3557026.1 hypothetical protein [Elizabethkingia meningoseptica]
MTTTLPTDDLKKYGIIDADNSFSKKLSAEDIQNFLQGATIVADNDKNRITFQLTDNNTQLNVKMYERDRSYKDLMDYIHNDPTMKVQYAYEKEIMKDNNERNFTKLAFMQKEDMHIYKYDMIKDAEKLTKAIVEKNNPEETNRYKNELLKLKEFLQEKIDKFPEIAKDITNDLNIVSNEINSVNSISPDEKQIGKDEKRDIQLGVNDPDMYEDANRHREEEQQQEEELHKPRGFRR